MDNEMKSYLQQMAIKTKIENFKEFGKTKEETALALVDKFNISNEKANQAIGTYWGVDVISDMSDLERRKAALIQEKNKMTEEYDIKLAIVDSVIAGNSLENIAEKYSVTVAYVRKIIG